jgi:ribosomal protein L11 methylase PrmA
VFSRLASSRGIQTVAFDVDPAAVEINYLEAKAHAEPNLLPLLLDFTNPSPGLGWAGTERSSLFDRGPVDCAMALALIHHLAISNNVPLAKLAETFARLCKFLIIEFVPKSDSQVKRLLASREDIFGNYDQAGFEAAFATCFETVRREPVKGTERTLYLMRRSQ